jgi:hypothetical protein
MKRIWLRPVAVGLVVLACAVYLPKVYWPQSAFYLEILTARRLQLAGTIAKLLCLCSAAAFSVLSATKFEKGQPARLPWLLVALWLLLWTAGYLCLAVFAFAMGARTAPAFSVADYLFLAGYAPLFAAELKFIFVYRASGFPIGSAKEHILIAVATTAAIGVASYVLLLPIATADLPWIERFTNVAYALGDLVALVPTVVMIRIALAFRPGAVWAVWAALLLGFLFTSAADIVAAYVWPGDVWSDPRSHLMYLLAYLFMAFGTKLQYELLTK